jgi:4-amino-4-deoxy-L-arabinose transferase-like glycosyltransferase
MALSVKGWVNNVTNQLFVALLLLAVYPLVYQLGHHSIHLWDESRLAVNASEMVLNHNWLVTHFDNKPDLWNTKPPLLIWLQAVSIGAFGNTEWAFRLPTAAATLVTITVLYWFCANTLQNAFAGLLSGLVLLTSNGFAGYHVAWSGDYDALLIMWQVLLLTAFFTYTETNKASAWWVVTLSLIGGVLTKGIAGVICLPALLLYGVYRKAIWALLTQKRFYLSVFLFFLFVGGYYGARELAAPGYWQAVQENELLGRYGRPQGGLAGPWYSYLTGMKSWTFTPWIVLLFPAVLLAALQPDGRQRRAVLWLLLFSGVTIGVVSVSATKALWYAAPAYPALALVVGLGLAWMYQALNTAYFRLRLAERSSMLLFVAFVFWLPYRTVVAYVQARTANGVNPYVSYLNTQVLNRPELNNLILVVPQLDKPPSMWHTSAHDPDQNYNPVYSYYKLAFANRNHLNFSFKNGSQLAQLTPGDTVVVCDAALQQLVAQRYEVRTLHQAVEGRTLLITGLK